MVGPCSGAEASFCTLSILLKLRLIGLKLSDLLLDFAHALGIPGVATHVGFVPEDHGDSDYIAVREMVRRVCDHCARNGQTFALETGQEPAETLKAFILDVDRPKLSRATKSAASYSLRSIRSEPTRCQSTTPRHL